ncbi:MAG: helix-turn-helix domain-containing protein [Armatimonadota bacterium]
MEIEVKKPCYLTVKGVAEYLHLSEDTIYRMVSRKQIPFFKLGKCIRFPVDAIDTWLESLSTHPESSEAIEAPPVTRARTPSRYAIRSTAPATRKTYPPPVREGYTPIYPVPSDL